MGQHQVVLHLHYRGPRRREKGAENLFEDTMAKKYLSLGKETDIQIQEAQRIPNKMNLKSLTPRHIINSLLTGYFCKN